MRRPKSRPALIFARLFGRFLSRNPLALAARDTSFTWSSPATAEVYGPGDTITAQWTSKKALVSPSVSLCTANDLDVGSTDCGGSVWPHVEQDGNQYSVSLFVKSILSFARDMQLNYPFTELHRNSGMLRTSTSGSKMILGIRSIHQALVSVVSIAYLL